MSLLQISPLLDSITLAPKILEKISFPQLCRFRSTCKKVDELVEEHRYYLATKKYDNVEIEIGITLANAFIVNYLIGEFDGSKILPNPVEQLSGLRVQLISFDEEGPFSPEKQSELVTIFNRWSPYADTIEIERDSGFTAETITGILWNARIITLNLNTLSVTVDELITLESVQRVTQLILIANEGGIPQERVLERLKNVKMVEFSSETGNAEWREYVVATIIPQLMQESKSLNEDDRSPTITFVWDGWPIDPESAFPNAHLIYSRITRRVDGDLVDYAGDHSYKIYALALEKRIVLLVDNLSGEYQQWTIVFLKKDKNLLKKTLEKETMEKNLCDRLLNHMFIRIVGEQ